MTGAPFWIAVVLGGAIVILAAGIVVLRALPQSPTAGFDVNEYRASQYGQGLLGLFSPAIQGVASGLQE